MTKKIIFSLLFTVFSLSQITFAFSDFNSTKAYSKAVEALINLKVLNGYSDNTLRLNQNINRAEFLKMALMLSKKAEIKTIQNDHLLENCFPDVQSEWFAPYICYAKNNGLVKGTNDGLFHPERTINFVEAAKIIKLLSYADPKQTDQPWYRTYIDYMSQNHFTPSFVEKIDQNLNRGQIAEILSRTHNLTDESNCQATTFSWDQNLPIKKIAIGSYILNDGKVFYLDEENIEHELLGSDYESFKAINGCIFFQDKNNVYFDHKILTQANLSNFKSDGAFFWGKDGKIYHVNGYNNEIKLIDLADAATFHRYQPHSAFFIDKNFVYNESEGKKIEGSDGPTFQILDNNIHTEDGTFTYGKDKSLLYLIVAWEGTSEVTIPNLDLNSFEIVADKVWKDQKNVYFWDKKIENIQPNQIKFLGRLTQSNPGIFIDFFQVNNQIYYYGSVSTKTVPKDSLGLLANADPQTFQIISNNLAQDQNHIYQITNDNFLIKKR